MASLRTLFFGVHASNTAIRVLFLPVCYVLLLAPFFVLAGYFLGFGRSIRAYIPEDFSWVDILPQVVLSAVFVLLPTRLLSGWSSVSKSKDRGKRRVQSLPYWIPGFRNFWSIVSGGEGWLKSVRGSTVNNIVTYNAFGAKHYVILEDVQTMGSLMGQIIENSRHLVNPKSIAPTAERNAYSMPSDFNVQESGLLETLKEHAHSEIEERGKAQLTAATLNILSESLPDFTTFNSSLVDQMQWERVADVELTDGTSEAECNFWALVNEFCCNAILPPLLGAQFTESYQLLATDLATFNRRYWALALGLPRLSPVQGLPGAALAQKRLIYNFAKLFNELTNPPARRVPDDDESVSGEETDADVLTPMAKLNDMFTTHDIPIAAQASIALQTVHEIIAEVVPLVFWILLHIYSTSTSAEAADHQKTPLGKIKRETGRWAQAIQPPSIHPSFPAPPEIIFSPGPTAVPLKEFPYLSDCILEARRLYSTPNAIYQVKKAFSIQQDSVQLGEVDTWEIEAGAYIDVGLSQSLIYSSPTVFPDPATYKPGRLIAMHTDMSTATAAATHDSAPYTTTLITALVTGIIQLWEIAPAPKKSFFEHMQEAREEAQIGAAALSGEDKAAKSSQVRERREKESKETRWELPKAMDGSLVKVPRSDVRVRIRRREGLPAKVAGRR